MKTRDDIRDDLPPPVVVNRAFAEKYFPQDSPIGARVVFATCAR